MPSFVPLGFDDDRWDEALLHKPKAACNPKSLMTIVYVGTLGHQFDVRALLTAVVDLPDWQALVIGVGELSGELRAEFRNDRIHFLGRRSPDETAALVATASLGAVPLAVGSTAVMPNKIYDYIGAGIPVLATGKGDAVDFVKENEIGITAGSGSESTKEAMSGIGPTQLRRWGAAVKVIRDDYRKSRIYQSAARKLLSAI